MATPFEDLQKEVRILRKEIRRLKGSPTANQAAVNELVGANPDEPGYGGGKFHAACNASGAAAIAELRDKAVRALNNDPAIIASPFAEEGFRQQYGSIHDLDLLIAAHRGGHRVR